MNGEWQDGGKVCGRKRASALYRDARPLDVRRQQRISYHSDLESRRGRTRVRLRNVACCMERPLARGRGGTQLPRRSANMESTGSGHAFIYAIPLCTNSRCPPTERQESNTSICQQSFVTRGL